MAQHDYGTFDHTTFLYHFKGVAAILIFFTFQKSTLWKNTMMPIDKSKNDQVVIISFTFEQRIWNFCAFYTKCILQVILMEIISMFGKYSTHAWMFWVVHVVKIVGDIFSKVEFSSTVECFYSVYVFTIFNEKKIFKYY